MQAVACHACGNRVLVEKYSLAHTSVQWTPAASESCPEFASRMTGGAGSAVVRTCHAMRDSIERAVADGAVTVSLRET